MRTTRHRQRDEKPRERGSGPGCILVGDMSQPRGGPMLTGHASHQVGLDADIWLTPAPARQLSRNEREEMSATMMVRDDRLDIDPKVFTPGHLVVIPRRGAGAERASASSSTPRSRRRCAARPRASATGCTRSGRCTATTITSISASNARPARPSARPSRIRATARAASRPISPSGSRISSFHPKPPKEPPKPKPPMTMAQLPPACRQVLNLPDAKP